MFELLFKYPLADYQAGHVELSWPWQAFAAAAAAGALFSAWRYFARPAAGTRAGGWPWLLALVRAGALATLLLALAQPVLVTPSATGHRGTVAVLVDDSRSMRVADQGAVSRAQWIRSELDPARPGLAQALARRFDVRVLTLSGAAEPDSLRFDASVTDIAAGLAGVRGAAGAAKLAAVVLLSDGAHNASGSTGAVDRALLELRAAGTPVMALGLGRPRAEGDVELALDPVPRSIELGNDLRLGVRVFAQGRAGERAVLTLSDDGRILERKEIGLPADGETAFHELEAALPEPGARRLRVAVEGDAPEAMTANNAREALVDVMADASPILYVEGEPRFELKFMRRAVEDDAQIRLVSLVRMAANRLYRLGVTGPEELEDGFPETAEALFRYRALVLGSVDAGFFDDPQRALIEAFVARRGGGLLQLGGRLSFAEGGHAGTPLAALSPVALSGSGTGPALRTVRPVLAAGAESHPLGRLLAQPGSAGNGLVALPDRPTLSIVNRWGAPKPGASVLLEDRASGDPLLVWQRYGRGLAAAFAPRDAWRWQMHPDVAVDDQSHEQFWRQLLRWLSDAAPRRVEIDVAERAAPGERVDVRIEARDADFAPAPAGAVTARLVAPDGTSSALPISYAPSGDAYLARFNPGADGLYEVHAEVAATDAGKDGARARTYVAVSANAHEPFASGLDRALLSRIADATGGATYAPADVAALVRDIESRTPTDTVLERRPLWNLPALMLALIALLAAEWPLRRWRGLR